MAPDPDRKEIARYLGYHGVVPDESMAKEIEYCVAELQRVATPRFVYDRFDAESDEDSGIVRLAGLEIKSRDLAVNLHGCCAAYLMAVTLGGGPDLLIKRASVGQMSRAVIYQAAAAAMVEAWCDEINARILREAERDGLYPGRARFSPGYGDLPLSLQREISDLLQMPKEIGVSLTESLLMTPSKSVTAIVGVGREHAGQPEGPACARCDRRETCDYRADA